MNEKINSINEPNKLNSSAQELTQELTNALNFKIYSSNDFPSYLPHLNAIYDDLLTQGKGFRAQLVQRVGHHLKLPHTVIHLLIQTIEFIHNASLLHDDLVDRSTLRRGKPTAWLRYTPEYAVLAGDYLLARVMVNLSQFGNLQLLSFTSQTISDLLEGEWLQDTLMKNWTVQLEKLDQVHQLKTASLFRWCLYAPFVAQNSPSAQLTEVLLEMGRLLGLLFQRSDDLLDFDVRNFEKKAVLGDLKSGYLNSFGAFLFKDLTEAQREAFQNAQNLNEIYQIIGMEYFNHHLSQFDALNKALIERFSLFGDQLSELLPVSQHALVVELKLLCQALYWRGEES